MSVTGAAAICLPADAEPVGRVTLDGMDGVFDVVPPSRCLSRWPGDGEVAASRLKSGYAALAPSMPRLRLK